MDLVTKDLLINFLFIILTLSILHILYMAAYSYRTMELKSWIESLFPIFSLVLCMLFPVYTNEHFVWDLRFIPFILGGLYGGYKLGLIQLCLVLIIRYFLGGDGFYTAAITFSGIGLVICLLSKYYLHLNLRQKIAFCVSLTVIGVLVTQFLAHLLFNVELTVTFRMEFAAINILGMFITIILWEGIRTNSHLLQNLIKAEKLQMVNHLAASISHEVRNPLTVSRGFIQLLSNELSIDKRDEYVNMALKELDRATDIINDYLTFAKPALEKKEKIDIFSEIQHAVNVISPLASMNNVQVKQTHLIEDKDHYFTLGERKKFQQCLINIMKNGIESMEKKGNELQIDLKVSHKIIKIDIRDQGTGMTQEQINRLGEPYFTTKEKGTGLGMMVSFSIIKGMNGTVNVESELGKGTCFTISLPGFQ